MAPAATAAAITAAPTQELTDDSATTGTASAALAVVQMERAHFSAQLRGGAPVPGTALVRALNTAVEGGLAETAAGAEALHGLARDFRQLQQHHTSADRGQRTWHADWAEFCGAKAEAIDTLLRE